MKTHILIETFSVVSTLIEQVRPSYDKGYLNEKGMAVFHAYKQVQDLIPFYNSITELIEDHVELEEQMADHLYTEIAQLWFYLTKQAEREADDIILDLGL